jgi:peptidoglycan/xylan/chitin deacetylase (PgdA/CDA1 family)
MSKEPRHHVGKVSYHKPITKCTKPGTVALTFDDGPSNNTMGLLDILANHKAKATFFIGGNNMGKGEVDKVGPWIAAIKRMDTDGHQVGSHTWSHPRMDNLNTQQRRTEMFKVERALVNIIGKYPTYMRSPYIQCSTKTGCMKDMSHLGYHVVN